MSEELFAPGHRACAGCGAALAARLALKGTGKDVIVVSPTGCLEVVSTPYPESAWRVAWIHSLFENAAAVASGIDVALKALGRRDEAKVVCIGGDGGTIDIGTRSLSGMLERGHDITYICYDNEAYMNCLSTSSLIMTRGGLKRITEVKEGDEIYAFDQKTHQLVLKRCIGVFDNGIKDVYELTTLHHSIKATANHPFLVLKRNGRGNENNFIWKTLSELKLGDEVVVLKNNKYFEMEEVREIKLVGQEPTLDLRVEGEHNFIADGIVVHNTGIQRSGSTPYDAATTTSPAGKLSFGNDRPKKNMPAIAAAHGIPYVATSSIAYPSDFIKKVKKAVSIPGPTYIQVHTPCPTGWGFDPSKTVEVGRLAVETALWPIYEMVDGKIKTVKKIKDRKPVEEFLKVQRRFKHLFKKEGGATEIQKIQEIADANAKQLGLDM